MHSTETERSSSQKDTMVTLTATNGTYWHMSKVTFKSVIIVKQTEP
jgi:hypothetical protein